MDPFPVLCDLDGVVWLAHAPIPGSVEAIAALRRAGHRVLFVTNNSSATVAEQEAALDSIGIPARGDVVTSAMAGASLVRPGESVLVCGGAGVVEAVSAVGARVVGHDEYESDPSPVDVVMVGFHRHFDYEIMRRAAHAVRGGARLVGTNDDATYPTPDGPIPGGGSILAAISVASGVTPIIAGKPYSPMGDAVRAILGHWRDDVLMVGDRPSTDGLFARTIGGRYALVRSGVTRPGEVPDVGGGLRIDIDADDLFGVAQLIGVSVP